MNAFEILKFTKKYFPLIRSDNEDFESYINNILDEYQIIVNESVELFDREQFIDSAYIELGREKFIDSFNFLSEAISAAITLYLNGFPNRAFDRLRHAMSKIQYKDKSIEYLNGSTIVGNGSYKFYRIRESDSKHSLSRSELFHVPFSQRRKIHTKRYSIPGLPSLYLSDSIYVAWEELGRPKFDQIQVARFELDKNFSILNLTTEIYCKEVYLNTIINSPAIKLQNGGTFTGYDEALKAVFMFPLILACSVKVNNNIDVFRPEYIVPQMLLQWITSNSKFQGICYTTSHINFTNNNFEGNFRNYVIPSTEREKDYCSKIGRMFNMTETVSAELVALNEKTNIMQLGSSKYENPKVKFVEIVKGQKSYYTYTKFASLEEALSRLPATKIDFI